MRRFSAALALLFLTALLLYLNFQSISLDDFDSGSFALALDHFDIGLQQPHPPGFPVYVAMGRAIRIVAGGFPAAVTLIRGINGAGGVLGAGVFRARARCSRAPGSSDPC